MDHFPSWMTFLLWMILSVWGLFGNHAQAIVVIDKLNLSNNIKQQIQTMAQWKQQYEQMTSQIKQLESQHAALTGSRNLGKIFDNPALKNYLPQDWQSVYDRVRMGGYAGLSGSGKEIYDQNHIFDSCSHIGNKEQRLACEARAVKPAQDKGFALDAYQSAQSRIQQIDQLMSAINTTQDPKAMAELQGRIAAEQANIQNEQTKLQMYTMVAAAEDRLQEQREREMAMQDAAKRGGLNIQPIKFPRRR